MKKILPKEMKIGNTYFIENSGILNENMFFIYLGHDTAKISGETDDVYYIKTPIGMVIKAYYSKLFDISEV
jgi:hypothetical protein